jgi:hypothetical protein
LIPEADDDDDDDDKSLVDTPRIPPAIVGNNSDLHLLLLKAVRRRGTCIWGAMRTIHWRTGIAPPFPVLSHSLSLSLSLSARSRLLVLLLLPSFA